MKNIVYFLGAGFSKAYGYPLTTEIMPEILHTLLGGKLENLGGHRNRESENELLEYLYLIYPGLASLTKDNIKDFAAHIPNITEVLSFVDHCCLYNVPPHPKLGEENLRVFQSLLKRALEELLLNYEMTNYTDKENALLQMFFDPIRNEKRESNVCIITTNYDLIIDEQFRDSAIEHRVNYGINYRNTETDESELIYQSDNSLLRYYGSLNWVKCEYCGQYYINPYGSILHQTFEKKGKADNTCICNDLLVLKSVMVTPSLVRDIRDSNLLQVWKGAMEAIRNADKLVFVGYSMPGEDLAIKSIIMRGVNGRQRKGELKVDVVSKGEGAKPNYQNLFGNRISYYANGLEAYLQKQTPIN
ncbi:hypothetical protein AAFN85_06300 [Mucilaginibacter sp. CAU 1740]|uniref:hypothetical protein n=1 Tax=Mucilaginibacter sp. CAU 1740 TaxID=3140365 RepID=UPI00325BFA53